MSGGHVHFPLFYKFRTSKHIEILRQSIYMLHILKVLKRGTCRYHILHHLMKINCPKGCSNAYFWGFRGGGHFWRVTLQLKRLMQNENCVVACMDSLRFNHDILHTILLYIPCGSYHVGFSVASCIPITYEHDPWLIHIVGEDIL